MNTYTGLDPVQYILSDDRPIYYGEMEVIHNDCPFLSISNNLDEELNLQILFSRKENSYQTVRFHLNQVVGQSAIENVLSDSLNSKSVKEAKIIVNGGTMFELTCNDAPLNQISKIVELPFGEIARYTAYPDRETYTLFSPTFKDMNGKERLLKLEEQLGQYGTVNLLEFRKLERKDHEMMSFLDRHGEFPEIWLNPDELNILNIAMDYGYFESPKRIGLDELAKKLKISRGMLSDRLRQINRHVLDRFVKQMNQPFLP